MKNFFECIEDRSKPISDVWSHHRTMTSCHLCNIALMLGRELKWDPKTEQFVDDEQAIALDPDYVLAHIGLARAYAAMADTGTALLGGQPAKGPP